MKKKEIDPPKALTLPSKPYNYSYSTKDILISICSVIQANAGFRCIANVFSIIAPFYNLIPKPAFSSIRGWLLKFGLYNLMKPKQMGDWIWIVDFSIQMGSLRCLYIVGIKAEHLRMKEDFTLSYEDLEPIVLKTISESNGEILCKILQEAQAITGEPIAIVSDQGSDIKKGIRLYKEGKNIIHLHDIIHKLDLILKKTLKNDVEWKDFMWHMNNTMQQLKMTTFAHLSPPKQRKKERMRSEIDNIEWGLNIIRYLDSGNATPSEKKQLSWIRRYRKALIEFEQIAMIFDAAAEEVRKKGYSWRTIASLYHLRHHLGRKSLKFYKEVEKTLKEEVDKIPTNNSYLGSSEILESLFGKFKRAEKDHRYAGLSSLVLSLPSYVGKITEEAVKQAMEFISMEDVKQWIEKNLGTTFLSKRRKCLRNFCEDLESYDFLKRCAM